MSSHLLTLTTIVVLRGRVSGWARPWAASAVGARRDGLQVVFLDQGVSVASNAPILTWWKEHAARFPYLSQLARRYLAMPATSASVERLFSVAGQIVTAKRASESTPRHRHTTCVFT